MPPTRSSVLCMLAQVRFPALCAQSTALSSAWVSSAFALIAQDRLNLAGDQAVTWQLCDLADDLPRIDSRPSLDHRGSASGIALKRRSG